MKEKLKNSFLGAFGLLGAVLAAAILGGFWGAGAARARVFRLNQSQDLLHRASSQLKNVLDLKLILEDFLRTGDDLHRQRFDTLLAATKSTLADMATMDQKDLQRERIKTVSALLDQWSVQAAQPQIEAKKRLAEVKVGTLVDPAKGEKLLKDLRGLLDEYEAAAGEEVSEATAGALLGFGRLNLMILAGGLLAAAAAAGILFHFLRTVVRPIEGILAWFEALRAGKPFALEITAANEIGDVADAFSRLGEDLRHVRREFELLAMTPETSPLPILELKPDGTVAYANPAAKALAEKAGLTPPELLPTDTAKPLADLAGKDAFLRRERTLNDVRYDFVFHSVADRELIFTAAFERAARTALPAAGAKKT